MDRRTALLALLSAASASALAMPALAQPVPAGPLSPDQYRLMALMGGELAIRTSQLALNRSRNPAVREFAQLEMNEQAAVAASLGARPGGVTLRPDQAALLQQAEAAPPARFDAVYVQGQIVGHEELLALNTSYARAGFDTVGQAVANLAVPSIQTHLSILARLRRNGAYS